MSYTNDGPMYTFPKVIYHSKEISGMIEPGGSIVENVMKESQYLSPGIHIRSSP